MGTDDWGVEDWDSPAEVVNPYQDLIDDIGQEEEKRERLESIKPSVGGNRAFVLVEKALAGGLQSAQQMYALLGDELARKGQDRATRTLMREGRRILEEAYGLDAVRLTVPSASSSYARIRPPDMDRTNEGAYTGYPLVVHKFDRKLRRLFGRGTETYYTPGTTFTGPDAVQKALSVHIKELDFEIARVKKEYERLEKSKSVSSDVDRRRRRLLANRDALTAEREHYAGVLASVQEEVKGGPVEQAAVPAAIDHEKVAAQMAAEGENFNAVRAYLIETGNVSARDATRLARVLTKKS